jgi:hypothetical protein
MLCVLHILPLGGASGYLLTLAPSSFFTHGYFCRAQACGSYLHASGTIDGIHTQMIDGQPGNTASQIPQD